MKRWKRKKTMAFELCVADAQYLHIYEHFKSINQNKVLQSRYWARSFTAYVHELHAQFQLLLPFSKSIHFEHPTALHMFLLLCGFFLDGTLPFYFRLLSPRRVRFSMTFAMPQPAWHVYLRFDYAPPPIRLQAIKPYVIPI